MKHQKSSSFKTNLRIILAIAWKDILQGWKNKVILSSIITSLFLVIFYAYLPDLTRSDELPLLLIYDKSETIDKDEFLNFEIFRVRLVTDEKDFLFFLRDTESPSLGVAFDEGFSKSVSGTKLVLSGYYPYWMNESQISELTSSAEKELSALWGSEIEIKFTGNIIYPIMDNYAYGKTFLTTSGLLIQLTLMGLSMAPQLIVEEKETRTLQAVMVSPARLSHFILGKGIAVIFYSLLTAAISFIFIGPLVIHWGLLIPILLLVMLALITPGILLGALLKSKKQISIWIWVVFIPTLLPLFLSVVRILPDSLLKIIDWWPTVVISRMLRLGFTYQPNISAYLIEAIYLVLLSVIFSFLTMWVLHKQTLHGD
jgi:hypothetical protein